MPPEWWDEIEEVALGVLGWKSEDLRTRSNEEFWKAYRGYLRQREVIRTQCYYMVSPYAKKGFSIDKIWLPGDIEKPKKIGIRKKLTQEEFIKEYKRAGLSVSEELLKRRFGTKHNNGI